MAYVPLSDEDAILIEEALRAKAFNLHNAAAFLGVEESQRQAKACEDLADRVKRTVAIQAAPTSGPVDRADAARVPPAPDVCLHPGCMGIVHVRLNTRPGGYCYDHRDEAYAENRGAR